VAEDGDQRWSQARIKVRVFRSTSLNTLDVTTKIQWDDEGADGTAGTYTFLPGARSRIRNHASERFSETWTPCVNHAVNRPSPLPHPLPLPTCIMTILEPRTADDTTTDPEPLSGTTTMFYTCVETKQYARGLDDTGPSASGPYVVCRFPFLLHILSLIICLMQTASVFPNSDYQRSS